MFHYVARAPGRIPLFRTHFEARALWDILTTSLPGLVAICLMPDHTHLLHPAEDAHERLGRAMQAYAQHRNAARRQQGRVWAPHPPAEHLPTDDKVRRTIRYIHLNPCRGALVADPLSWPWSSHRDAVGLTARPVVPRVHSPERFHAYVSGDPTVSVGGTLLPVASRPRVDWYSVRDAVSAFTRVPFSDLTQRGEARTLAVRVAWDRGVDLDLVASQLGISRRTAFRSVEDLRAPGAARRLPALAAVARLLGDDRFGGLADHDLAKSSAWLRYLARPSR